MLKRVFVAGHNGMVGSAIVRALGLVNNVELILRNRSELDLLDQSAVFEFFDAHRIDEVYLAAAKVGGIHANNEYPAEFIYENLTIQNNVIQGAHLSGVNKLLFLGSSCIYPKSAAQPIVEEALLSGFLEPTNEPYAIAKIAGIKLCESYNRQFGGDFRSIMPTNLYGPGDNFHPKNSHVIPGLLRRFHQAKIRGEGKVVAWGSGTPMREFLHVDDLAAACLFVMALSKSAYKGHTSEMQSHLNVGSGEECQIRDLVSKVANVVGFEGDVEFDASKPDGTPRKLMDIKRMVSLGWEPRISLDDGLRHTYEWFINNQPSMRGG